MKNIFPVILSWMRVRKNLVGEQSLLKEKLYIWKCNSHYSGWEELWVLFLFRSKALWDNIQFCFLIEFIFSPSQPQFSSDGCMVITFRLNYFKLCLHLSISRFFEKPFLLWKRTTTIMDKFIAIISNNWQL